MKISNLFLALCLTAAMPVSATGFGSSPKADADASVKSSNTNLNANVNKPEANANVKSTNVNANINKPEANAAAVSGSKSNATSLSGAVSGSISGAVAEGGDGGKAKSNATGGNANAFGGASLSNSSGGDANVGDTTSKSNSRVGNVTSGPSTSNADSASSSHVGDTTATVGDTASSSSSNAVVGDATATAGDSTSSSSNEGNTVQGGDVVVQGDNFEAAAASAASIFAGYCQNGASVQLQGGGLNVLQGDQFCDHVRLADLMRAAYEYEQRAGGDPEKADMYLEGYHDNLADAIRMIESTEMVSLVDRQTGFVLRPAMLVGLLIFLL